MFRINYLLQIIWQKMDIKNWYIQTWEWKIFQMHGIAQVHSSEDNACLTLLSDAHFDDCIFNLLKFSVDLPLTPITELDCT